MKKPVCKMTENDKSKVHEKGPCPVPLRTNVAVLLSDGSQLRGPAGTFRWACCQTSDSFKKYPCVIKYVVLSHIRKKRAPVKRAWIDRTTRHCPVPAGQRIRVAYGSGHEEIGEAGNFDWDCRVQKSTIVKYCLERPILEQKPIQDSVVSHEVTISVKGVYITSLPSLLKEYVKTMKQVGLNQEKVAEKLNVSLHTLKAMMLGSTRVSEQVAKHLGYRPTNLYARIEK